MNVKKKSALREWVESIIVAFIIAMFIRTFFVQAFKIPTGSMRTTLLEGDRILVNKFIYGIKIPFTDYSLPALQKPKRGEVIVFVSPEDPKRDFVKRLVALGGEKVQIKNGTLYINDKALEAAAFNTKYYYNRGEYGMQNQEVTVKNNAYFVLGDNSASSRDSRYWGFVPEKNLIGKAFLIYWPLQRIRIIK
jgi:signal peptidase I